MRLSESDFLEVVARTPLVSIDLILRSDNGKVLLGRRANRPAQGVWFVPGGRIRKNESLSDALVRIVRTELGEQVPVEGWKWVGVFEHFYPDNFAGKSGVTTHYVVLAVERIVNSEPLALDADLQHTSFVWEFPEAILSRDDVHPNTKAYFDSTSSFCGY